MTPSGTVLSFFRPRNWTDHDWTQQELAEFYRVEAALIRSGLLVDVDRGISDEGDPWFVFCRRDNGEVIAHFARIGNDYVVVSSAFPGVVRGRDFGLLLSELIRGYPMVLPRALQQAENVYLHPAAMLVALLATAFVVSDSEGHDHDASHSLGKDVLRLLSLGEFAILSAVAIATTWIDHQIDIGLKFLENEHSSQSIENDTRDHGRADEGLINIIETVLKIASDFGTSKISDAFALASAESQHQADSPMSVPLHTAITLNAQANSSEKILDIIAGVTHAASGAEPNHSPWSPLAVADNLPSVQALLPDSTSGSASLQTDHPTVPQNNQLVVVQMPTASSTDAYHALALDLSNNKINAPTIVFEGNLSLESSIQKVLSNLQLISPNQSTPSHAAEVHSAVSAAPTLAPPTSSPPVFDAHADALLSQFVSSTPNIEADIVGQHVVLVDKNPTDVANSHYSSLSWAFADGSTLTIVGIIPSSAQAGIHMSG